MRKLLVLAALLAALVLPALASAHPLGNFTVNRYAGVELSGGRVYVRYVLDLAEIPTFQDGARVRAPGFAGRLAGDVRLTVDGRRSPLRVLESRASARPGAGGLPTLRFEAVYEAASTGSRLTLEDHTFGSRVGWREITIRASNGAAVRRASVPAESESDALRAYPPGLLRSPLDVDAATATFVLAGGAGVPPRLGETAAPVHAGGGFESLVARDDLSAGVVLLSLLVAAFWGAAHALTPGHGKAVVAAYLVGTRGRARDALALGGIVTVTHTIGVFSLGLVTLLLSELVVPDQLYPWLNLVAAVLVVGVGAAVLRQRVHSARAGAAHARAHRHGHAHHHHHEHEHLTEEEHARAHLPEGGSGARGLLAAGVSGGLLPCPTALVVLLAAISLHRVAFGMALILAFSVGLAAVVSGIGLLAIGARGAFSRLSLEGPLVRALPAVSALLILGIGVAMTLRALPGVV
jgi:ABC-type nickel/cobalt efflux system permease component RcnA